MAKHSSAQQLPSTGQRIYTCERSRDTTLEVEPCVQCLARAQVRDSAVWWEGGCCPAQLAAFAELGSKRGAHYSGGS